MKFFIVAIFCVLAADVLALVNPEKVYLVVNDNDPDSMSIAQTYCRLRDVPMENILVFSMPSSGFVSRKTYFEQVESPIIRKLIKKGAIKAIDTESKDAFGREIFIPSEINVDFLILCKGVPWQLVRSQQSPSGKKYSMQNTDAASVDSELSACFIPQKNFDFACKNPLFKNYKNDGLFKAAQILRVARLDGVSKSEIISALRRTVDAERNGLRGRVYIDQSKYSPLGDKWLEKVKLLMSEQYFDVSENPDRALFSYSERFDGVAVYFGWYTYGAYGYFKEKNMSFADGAIGWHIYSFSASQMRNPVFWSPTFVRLGAGATVGNVHEPFLSMTHHADLFIEALLDGKTAGEAAYASIPVLSWQNVFFGDPMYRPFLVSLEEQVESLEKGKFDKYSQYVVVRQMNKLMKTSSRSEAEAFAKRFIGNLPDDAILFKFFEMRLKDGNLPDALKYANMIFERDISEDASRISIFMGAACLLSFRKGEAAVLGMKFCERLLDADMDSDFGRHIAASARRISQINPGILPSERMKNLFEKVDRQIAEEKAAAEKRAAEKKASEKKSNKS